MKWNHILDKQPENGESIIHIEPPYQGHYLMGMETYIQYCLFEDLLKFNKENDLKPPNFWWISASEFPFPDLINDL